MRRPVVLLVAACAVAFAGLSSTAAAQDRRPEPTPAQRDSLEARVRARMAMMLRSQLGLSDEQLRRFQATNQKFEGQRRSLFEQERDVRRDLRTALAASDTAQQQARVATLLDRTLQLQRQRLELVEAEQRELATFLTPVQRARLFGIEEQIRRRVMEMREQQGDRSVRPMGPGLRRPGADGPTPGAPRRPPEAR